MFMLGLAGVCIMALAVPSVCESQGFPSKPIQIICGYTPGSSTDLQIRAIAESLERQFKQPVLIENVPGAGGTIAVAQMSKNKADGYSFSIASGGALMSPLHQKLPFDVDKLSFICQYNVFGNCVWVHADAPWKSFKEFIEYGQKNPGELVWALEAPTGVPRLQLEVIFEQAGGVKYTLMATQGSAESVRMVLAKDADFIIMSLPPTIQHYRAGTLRPLLVTVPFDLLGIPKEVPKAIDSYDMDFFPCGGTVGPSGMPEDIRRQLSDAIRYALEKDEISMSKLDKMGAVRAWRDGPEWHQWALKLRGKMKKFLHVWGK